MQSLVTQYLWLTGRCWVTTYLTKLFNQLLSPYDLLFCASSSQRVILRIESVTRPHLIKYCTNWFMCVVSIPKLQKNSLWHVGSNGINAINVCIEDRLPGFTWKADVRQDVNGLSQKTRGFDMYYTLPEFAAMQGNTTKELKGVFFVHQNKSTSLHAIFFLIHLAES